MNGQTNTGSVPMKCDDIRALLFDYLTRELGEARAALVREHLRKCEGCRAAAAEIEDTLDLLRAAESGPDIPDRLSERHRDRILWAFAHPGLDWVYRHHVLVSLLATALVLALAALVMSRLTLWKPDDIEPGVTVTIGDGHRRAASTNRPGAFPGGGEGG